MNRREKVYLAAIVVLVALLFVKSFVLDPVKLTDPQEIVFGQWVESKIDEDFNGFIYDNNIVVTRLVSVKVKTEDEKEMYVGKVRRYFLGLIPMSDRYIKEETAMFEQ